MLESSDYQWAMLLTCIREVYEAVALVSFMEIVVTILGGTQHLAQLLHGIAVSKDPVNPPLVYHVVWPLSRLLLPYRPGSEFVRSMLMGIFQYVFVCLAYFVMILFIWILDCTDNLSPCMT